MHPSAGMHADPGATSDPAGPACRFFEDYKKNENKEVRVDEILGRDAALKVIQAAMDLYKQEYVAKRARHVALQLSCCLAELLQADTALGAQEQAEADLMSCSAWRHWGACRSFASLCSWL